MDRPQSPASIPSSPEGSGPLSYFRSILMSQNASPSFNYSSPGRVVPQTSPHQHIHEDAPEQPVKHRSSSGGVAVPRTPTRRVHSIVPLYVGPELQEAPEKSSPPECQEERAWGPHVPAPLVVAPTKKPSPPGGFSGSRDFIKEDPTSPSSFKIHNPTFKLAYSNKPTLSLTQNTSSGIVRISTPIVSKPVVLPPARNGLQSTINESNGVFSSNFDEIAPESQEDPAAAPPKDATKMKSHQNQHQHRKKRKRSSKKNDDVSPKRLTKSFRAVPLYEAHNNALEGIAPAALAEDSIDQTLVQFAAANYDDDRRDPPSPEKRYPYPANENRLQAAVGEPSEIPPTPEPDSNGPASHSVEPIPFEDTEDPDADAIIASPVASPRRHRHASTRSPQPNHIASGEVVGLDFADIEDGDDDDAMDVDGQARVPRAKVLDSWDQLLPSAIVLAPATASPMSPIKSKFSHLPHSAGQAEDVDSSIDEQASRPLNATIDFVDKSMEDQFDDVDADILTGGDDEESLARTHNAARRAMAQVIRIRSTGGDEDSESIIDPTIESSDFAIPPADDAAMGDRLVLVSNAPNPSEAPVAAVAAAPPVAQEAPSFKLQSKFDIRDKNTQYRDMFAPGTKLFSSLVGAGTVSSTASSTSSSYLVKRAHDLAKSLFFYGKKSLDHFLASKFDTSSFGSSFSDSNSHLIAHVLQVDCDRFVPGLWTLKCRLLFPNAPSGHPTSVYSKALLRVGWNDSNMTDSRLSAPVAGTLLALMASSHLLLEHRPLPILLCAVWYPMALDLGFDPSADLPVFIDQFEQFKASGSLSETSEANQQTGVLASGLASLFPGSHVSSIHGSSEYAKKRPSDLSLLDVSALVRDADSSPSKKRKISEFVAENMDANASQYSQNAISDLTLGGLSSMPASASSQVTCPSDILSRLFRERLNISHSPNAFREDLQQFRLILQLDDGSIVEVLIPSRSAPSVSDLVVGAVVTIFDLRMVGQYYEKYGSPSSHLAKEIEEVFVSDSSILPLPAWNMNTSADLQSEIPKFLNNSESQTDALMDSAKLVEKPPTQPPAETAAVSPHFHRWCYFSLEHLPNSTLNIEPPVKVVESNVTFSRLNDILDGNIQHQKTVSFVCLVVAGPQLVSIGVSSTRPRWAVFCWDESLAHLSGRVLSLQIDQSMVKHIHTSDILIVKNAIGIANLSGIGRRYVALSPASSVGRITHPRLGVLNFSAVLDPTQSQLMPSQAATQATQSTKRRRGGRTKKTAAVPDVPLIDFTNEIPLDLLSPGESMARIDVIPSRLYILELVDNSKPLYFQWPVDSGEVITSRSLDMSDAAIASFGGSLSHPQDLQPGDLLFFKGIEIRGKERQASSIKVCHVCGSKVVDTPRLLVFSPQERHEKHYFCNACVSRRHQYDDQVIDVDVVTVKDYFGTGVDLRLLAAPHGKSARPASSNKKTQQWTFPAGFKGLLLHMDASKTGCDVLCLSDKMFL